MSMGKSRGQRGQAVKSAWGSWLEQWTRELSSSATQMRRYQGAVWGGKIGKGDTRSSESNEMGATGGRLGRVGTGRRAGSWGGGNDVRCNGMRYWSVSQVAFVTRQTLSPNKQAWGLRHSGTGGVIRTANHTRRCSLRAVGPRQSGASIWRRSTACTRSRGAGRGAACALADSGVAPCLPASKGGRCFTARRRAGTSLPARSQQIFHCQESSRYFT